MIEDNIDVDFIQPYLAKDQSCYWVDTVRSTQAEVRPNSLLIAEHQSAGVGRRGNYWLTPKGRAISMSYRFELPLPAAQMAGYQITIALAIVKTILSFAPTAEVQLKWPNDLYHGDKKFAGILINLIPNQQHTEVIVGLGINWLLTAEQIESVDQPVCNIPLPQLALNQMPNRSQFIAQLVQQIEIYNQKFIQQGLTDFLIEWQKHDFLANKAIEVRGEQRLEIGQYQGINQQGELMLHTIHGNKTFCSGEVSVKAV